MNNRKINKSIMKNSVILVLNSGSSSLKYSLFKNGEKIFDGLKENIGLKSGEKNHQIALEKTFKEIQDKGIIKSLKEIRFVGHRVVHGGEIFKKTTLINKNNFSKLEKISFLAPLHNPYNILGIEICLRLLPWAKNYAVFDTEFYSSLNEEAYLYALPIEFYQKYKIRRYGFHGISHNYVFLTAEKILRKKIKKAITCHLGAGSSITAILDGKPIDTSMGFTPLEGLIMETRCGSIDPSIPLYLINNHNFNAKELDDLFNKQSGFKGICGLRDFREILKMKTEKSKLCYKMYLRSVIKQIGAYIALLNGVEVIIFTAGIGEGSYKLRKDILSYFKHLGIKIDQNKNKLNKTIISKPESKIKVLVIHTDEAFMIYQKILNLINKN